MNKKALSLSLIGLLATVAAADAAITVNISTNPNTGSFFTLSGASSRVADGSLVRVGFMSETPAANATFDALETLFTEFATTTSGHSSAAGANKGMINRSGIVDGPALPAETAFQGKQVYIWVYNAGDKGAATQVGVFTSTDAAWKFPDNPDAVPNSLSTSLITNAYGVGLTAAGITPGVQGGAPQNYQLANLVPETSTFTMSMLVGVGLLARRRR